eukprot:TRINITY_DN1479_c0_g1_i1.p1 TRINITY_DN1479_c0_g1~~TRINITY_DN1479_c0_g1_i1.p1  ORF type:complete len:576 (+),score=258.53 TRINITY_DN1479_c0_g1_i1:191-1918(+)
MVIAIEALWETVWVNFRPREDKNATLTVQDVLTECMKDSRQQSKNPFTQFLARKFIYRTLPILFKAGDTKEKTLFDEKAPAVLFLERNDPEEVERRKADVPPVPAFLKEQLRRELIEEISSRKSAQSLVSLSARGTSSPNLESYAAQNGSLQSSGVKRAPRPPTSDLRAPAPLAKRAKLNDGESSPASSSRSPDSFMSELKKTLSSAKTADLSSADEDRDQSPPISPTTTSPKRSAEKRTSGGAEMNAKTDAAMYRSTTVPANLFQNFQGISRTGTLLDATAFPPNLSHSSSSPNDPNKSRSQLNDDGKAPDDSPSRFTRSASSMSSNKSDSGGLPPTSIPRAPLANNNNNNNARSTVQRSQTLPMIPIIPIPPTNTNSSGAAAAGSLANLANSSVIRDLNRELEILMPTITSLHREVDHLKAYIKRKEKTTHTEIFSLRAEMNILRNQILSLNGNLSNGPSSQAPNTSNHNGPSSPSSIPKARLSLVNASSSGSSSHPMRTSSQLSSHSSTSPASPSSSSSASNSSTASRKTRSSGKADQDPASSPAPLEADDEEIDSPSPSVLKVSEEVSSAV